MYSASATDSASQAPLEFHPQAPRPDFLWKARLPLTWRYLDTHPASWKLKAQRLAEDYIPGHRLKSAEKRLVLQQLEAAVKAAQDAGALMTFVLPGVLDNGEVSAATLIMRWQDTSPHHASLQPAKKAFPDVEVRKTGKGLSFGFVRLSKKAGPITQQRVVHTAQAFLPIPQSTWTLVVSGSAPSEELAEIVGDHVVRLVEGVAVFPGTEGMRIADLDSDVNPEQTDENAAGQDSANHAALVVGADHAVHGADLTVGFAEGSEGADAAATGHDIEHPGASTGDNSSTGEGEGRN